MNAMAMVSLLSWLFLVMAVGGGLHANLVSGEAMIVSNPATVTAYWKTMLPNTPMPSAILELVTPPAGNDDVIGTHVAANIQSAATGQKDVTKGRKIRMHSIEQATTKREKFEGQGMKIDNNKKYPFFEMWGPSTSRDQGMKIDNNKKFPFDMWPFDMWGPSTSRDQRMKIDNKNVPARKADDQKSTSNVQEDGHVGQEQHTHVASWSNMVLLEEALTLGSRITPYVPAASATFGAPLLQRDVAYSIPLSTENFTDILTMLGPVSHAMVDDIWLTLHMCEHPRRIKGEKKACAASLESMLEFAASVLAKGSGGDLRAFSFADAPAEGMTSGRSYEVTAVQKATGSSETMTCHGMSFPYAVFMCHAVNPTRVYKVTLESEEGHGGAGPQKVEALAVCHLDTSEFDPRKMPGNVKPGEAPVCHFMSRDSVLWAPVAEAAAT